MTTDPTTLDAVLLRETHDAVEVQQAALVDDDRHALHLEDGVELRVHFRVQVELVLEARAAAAHHAHAQVKLAKPARKKVARPT